MGGNRPKLTFMGWKERAALALGREVAAGDVAEERAKRSGGRRRHPRPAKPLRGRGAAGQQADGGALDIAFAARDLAGKAQARLGLEPQLAVEQLRAS